MNRNSRHRILLVDIEQEGIAIRHHRLPDAHDSAISNLSAKRPSLCLRMPRDHACGLLPIGPRGTKWTISKVAIARTIEAAVKATGERDFSPGEWIIVIGCRSDPLLMFQRQFDAALSTIEALVELEPAFLVLQTRSPLALLTTPLLSARKERTMVTIAVEAIGKTAEADRKIRQTGGEDALAVCRTLRSVGIATLLQACPPAYETSLRRYAENLIGCSDYLYAADRQELTGGLRGLRPSPSCARFRRLLASLKPEHLGQTIVIPDPESAWLRTLRYIDDASLAA